MSTPTKTIPRFSLRRLEVVRVTDLTPHMRRITLGGEAMAGFPEECNGFNVKMFILCLIGKPDYLKRPIMMNGIVS
jgi:NADPH-dependent ferric siderophore reductase